MEQEHRLTYKAGITRTPSDFLCSDGELAECINLATDTEELKPMVQPVRSLNTQDIHTHAGVPISENLPVIYIHRYNDQKRYIYTKITHDLHGGPDSYRLYWGYDDDGNLTYGGNLITTNNKLMKVTSIGKTLIVTADDGMHYYLWKAGEYSDMGELPKIDISFSLQSQSTSFGDDITFPYSVVRNSGKVDGIYNGDIRDQEAFNDVVAGLYAKNKKAVCQKKGFCEPFFIRAAIEMFDNTYHFVGNPTLLFPAVKDNSFTLYGGDEYTDMLCMYTGYALAYVTQNTEFNDWSDIVKDVVLFVTDGISIYDTNVDQRNVTDETTDLFNGVYSILPSELNTYHSISKDDLTGIILPTRKNLVKRDENEIVDDIKSSSIYYKLCSIGIHPVTNISLAEKIHTHTLENITTQTRLEYDDYYSHCKIFPQFLYSYNSRLNITNVKRGFFNGYSSFIVWDNNSASVYDIWVTIKTDAGDVVVRETTPLTYQKMGMYFYYPDSRATNVVIKQGNTTILDAKLSEHPGLNGAYYFAGLPGSTDPTPDTSGQGSTSETAPTPYETLPNYIIQSEVNNPWVFKAEGYHKVGTGKIVGMSTTTQALSMSQYGPFPLLVFSESGVWAMSVDKTGLYADIQPISRDICLAPSTITQTDGAVFFVSKKGLMVAERAGNGLGVQIGCVSERMNGVTFNTSSLSPLATGTDWAGIVSACQGDTSFLDFVRSEKCFMAYDYIDSRLLMLNPTYSYSYVYNMADGTISKTVLPSGMLNAVNDYPDYLLQGSDGYLYSFYEKPREEEVGTRQLAFLLTRPMKLAGPVSQASLRQLKNVGTWRKKDAGGNELSCVKTELYLSEDMQTWYADKSRFGAAARYYRLALYIKMLPTERLSGTILTEQPRRSNNMR